MFGNRSHPCLPPGNLPALFCSWIPFISLAEAPCWPAAMHRSELHLWSDSRSLVVHKNDGNDLLKKIAWGEPGYLANEPNSIFLSINAGFRKVRPKLILYEHPACCISFDRRVEPYFYPDSPLAVDEDRAGPVKPRGFVQTGGDDRSTWLGSDVQSVLIVNFQG